MSNKSLVIQLFLKLYKKTPVFVWASCYFVSLYFVSSNLTYLLVSVFFFLLLYIVLKNLKQAIFYTFIANLPFAQGKSFAIILIPRDLIPTVGLFDVGYFFPLYPSIVYLIGTIYIVLRKRNALQVIMHERSVLSGWGLFILICSIPLFFSPFPLVVGLSVLQLISMGCIYLLPHWLRLSREGIHQISHILSAFVIFECGWIGLQIIHAGPVGRYIEAILPLNRIGILSTEDQGFMRFNGTFMEPSILGTFMLMHALYFGILLIRKTYISVTERNLYILSLICSLISIIFTGSRGIYGLLLFFGLFIFRSHIQWIRKKINLNKSIKYILISTLIVLLLSSYFLKRAETIIPLMNDLSQGQGSAAYRVELNTLALRLGTNSTFGVGLNLSPYYFAYEFPLERTVDPSQPHNLIFQLLAETGFPGLIAFSIFLWLLFRRYITHPLRIAEPYLFAAVSYLCAAQFYPIFISQSELCSFFFLHAGLMTWVIQSKKYET